jgi:hypothetical protein
VAGAQLYVNPADGKLYRLSQDGNSWDECGAVENPRVVHRMVPARRDLLLVLGGSSRAGNVAVTETIVPLTKPSVSAAAPESLDPTRQTCCPVMTKMLVDDESRDFSRNRNGLRMPQFSLSSRSSRELTELKKLKQLKELKQLKQLKDDGVVQSLGGIRDRLARFLNELNR